MDQNKNQGVFGDIAGQLKDPLQERIDDARKNLHSVLNMCHAPAIKMDMEDGTERYLCNIYSNIGTIHRFDITPDGILDIKCKKHSENLSYFPINVPVAAELMLGKEKVRLFLQNRMEYKS